MRITKKQLKRIIKEELMREGLHYEGLMETMIDALKNELGSWQPEAKSTVYEELASKGLDLTKTALNILDDEAGRHPGGAIGEDMGGGAPTMPDVPPVGMGEANAPAKPNIQQSFEGLAKTVYHFEDETIPLLATATDSADPEIAGGAEELLAKVEELKKVMRKLAGV